MGFFPNIHDSSQDNVFGAETSNPEFEKFYEEHIRKLLFVRGGSRYVAKGNYNVTRLQCLKRLFPNARFVIPVRNPVSHVASLMKQHRLFCEEEKRDPRVLRHMCRVGHFEFGLDFRPINVGNRDVVEKIQRLWSTGQEVRGWAHYWASVYGFVADVLESDTELAALTFVVQYEDLCHNPLETLTRLYDHCEIEVGTETLQEEVTRLSPPSYCEMPFTDDQKAAIEEVTAQTQARIRRLGGQCP
jgi:hypothetical protein